MSNTFSIRTFISAATLAAIAACGGSSSDSTTPPPPTPTPAITLSLASSSASITAGGNGTVTATVSRSGGFAGAVDISVEGLPTGVTASATPTSIASTATTAAVSFTVASTASAATSNVTVRAKGAGVTDQTASFALTVTAAAPAGAYTIALSPTSLSATAGGAAAKSKLTITRTSGFSGAVTVAVTGAPTGVTASMSAVAADTATLTVTAASTAATSSATLTVTASAAGLADRTATASLAVTAAASGSTGAIAWQFCDASNLPLWFAVQDGTGSFTRVTGSNNLYKFDIASAKGAVAFVTSTGANLYQTSVYYGTPSELTDIGTSMCIAGTSVTKKLTGTVAGLGGGESALINFGGRSASLSANGAFTLDSAADGARDLIAGKSVIALTGGGISTTLSKIIIRRGINPAAGSALPALDFSASEAFAPVSKTLTIANGNGETGGITIGYYTSAAASAALYVDLGLTGISSRTYYGVPAANQASGDRHFAAVSSFGTVTPTNQTARITTIFFKDATDRTVTLGAAPSTVALTSAGTSPYPRFRTVATAQSDYSNLLVTSFAQLSAGITRNVLVYQTSGHRAGAASWDITFPDLSAVAGWDPVWPLRSGVSTTVSTVTTGYSSTGAVSPTSDGGIVKNGVQVQTVTP